MLRYEEGLLEKNELGACFPSRPYYPLTASNGTDAILLSLGGFPDEPNWMCYSAQLPSRICLGWYKTARKDYAYSNTRYGPPAYGTSIALAAPTTTLMIGREQNSAIRDPEQFFDPKKKVLTTLFELEESRGEIRAKIKVTSFMTNEHLLVERYEVLREPQSGIRFGFKLDTPRSTDLHELCVHPKKVEFEKMERGLCFAYQYESPEIYDGMAATWADCEDDESEITSNHPSHCSPVVREGHAVTHYVAVIDSYDSKNFRAEIRRLVEKTLAAGYDAILEEHVKSAREYMDASTVTLPEKDLEYLYDYSCYVLDACFDRETGFMPMGILPDNWQNAMFWDCWFASMAWLGSNRLDDSKRISRFYKNKLAEAKSTAAKLGCNGARYAWTTNRAHFEMNPETTVQFHNNAVIALQSLQIYQYTQDKDFLADVIEMVEQALLFLAERLVKIENGRLQLTECAGIDESTSDQKTADTWTVAVWSKAMDLYLEACGALNRSPFRDDLREISAGLKAAMDRNVDKNGILQSFAGGRRPHCGSLMSFLLYPDHPAIEKTVKVLSHYDGELDSYASGGMTIKGRIFTWSEFRAAALFGLNEKSEGWTRLKQCAKFSDCFGSFPERVFYRGELHKLPFMTSHACYILALRNLLMHRDRKRLAIFMALPEKWSDLSFRNLTADDGLKVSAEMKNRKITGLEIVNAGAVERDVELVLPDRGKIELTLKSNESYVL